MQVDTIIHAGWILPIEPAKTVYQKHSLVINNGVILDILPTTEVAKKYQANVIESRLQHVLMPGLINSHTHAAMSLMRGIADDLPLHTWLEQHIWPCEQQWVDAEFVRVGTDLAIAEMLRGGTTCFNDMYFYPEVIAAQAEKHGIRANVGLILLDFASSWADSSSTYLQQGLELQQQYKNHSLIRTPFAPHAPYTVSDAPLIKVAKYAQELDLPIHMHVHETANEVQTPAIRPLQRLQNLGLLTPHFMAVHMTQLQANEIETFATTGAHIVHCPESNLKLASGFFPLSDCLAVGINVALGTDGAASNNDLDMFAEMRTAALLAKGVAGNASVVPAQTALEMATINGAKALGISEQTGSLKIGKAADVIAIDLNYLESMPMYDLASHLVYVCSRQQVTDTWVAGRHLLNNRILNTFDLETLKTQVLIWQQRLNQHNTKQ